MNRYLDFFEPTIDSSIRKPLEEAHARGARKVLLAGPAVSSHTTREHLQRLGFSCVEQSTKAFQAADIADNDVILITCEIAVDVSRALHACIGSSVSVIAPVTDHHISKRTVFLMSIPKAGTHMLIRLLTLMGLERSSDRAPRPGTWSTPVGYEYHAPCRELLANDWADPVGRQLLFRSPAIFVYRNPLDILISELDWFVKAEHAFSGYLSCCADDVERLSRLIADDTVMGSIRDRINRYTGWMNFGNVVPVSYEELVGSRGGGSDTLQSDSIWALQLKLHISGSPEEFGKQIYDPGSATFSKGRIARHLEHLASEHFALFHSLPQDFMHALGYSKGVPTSSRVAELQHRPLMVKNLPMELLYTPRLVRENLLGWNIVEFAGQYFPVQQGEPLASAAAALEFSRIHDGYMTLQDAANAAIRCTLAPNPAPTVVAPPTGTTLVIEGFMDFNVIQHHGRWYGFHQALGPLDIESLDTLAIDAMKKKTQCVTGESVADIKAEVLSLVVQEQRFGSSKPKHKSASAGNAETDRRLKELALRIDADRLRSATDLDAVQTQLRSITERQESTSDRSTETDRRLRELRSLIDAEYMERIVELKSIQEQLGSLEQQLDRLSLLPLAGLDR